MLGGAVPNTKVILTLFCIVVLTACPKPEDPPPKVEDKTPRPKKLVLATNFEPDTLNPVFAQLIVSFDVMSLGQQFITFENERSEPVPDLVEVIPTRENGGVKLIGEKMEVTWKIKDNATWDDGVPVTAVVTWPAGVCARGPMLSRPSMNSSSEGPGDVRIPGRYEWARKIAQIPRKRASQT